jgi:hypothetical protein
VLVLNATRYLCDCVKQALLSNGCGELKNGVRFSAVNFQLWTPPKLLLKVSQLLGCTRHATSAIAIQPYHHTRTFCTRWKHRINSNPQRRITTSHKA